mgnify:CR=1 FL=1
MGGRCERTASRQVIKCSRHSCDSDAMTSFFFILLCALCLQRALVQLRASLITAAAVTCADKGKFVGWIMNMTEHNQFQMKSIIQSSLSRLEDLEEEDDEGGDGF